MIVNCSASHVFGSGSSAHYSRINTPDGRVLTLARAAGEGLIERGEKIDRGDNGFVGEVDQEIFALVDGLTVTQHDWADPGPDDRPATSPLPMRTKEPR